MKLQASQIPVAQVTICQILVSLKVFQGVIQIAIHQAAIRMRLAINQNSLVKIVHLNALLMSPNHQAVRLFQVQMVWSKHHLTTYKMIGSKIRKKI